MEDKETFDNPLTRPSNDPLHPVSPAQTPLVLELEESTTDTSLETISSVSEYKNLKTSSPQNIATEITDANNVVMETTNLEYMIMETTSTDYFPITSTDYFPIETTSPKHDPIQGSRSKYSPVQGNRFKYGPSEGTRMEWDPFEGARWECNFIEGTRPGHNTLVQSARPEYENMMYTSPEYVRKGGTIPSDSPMEGTSRLEYDTMEGPINIPKEGTSPEYAPKESTVPSDSSMEGSNRFKYDAMNCPVDIQKEDASSEYVAKEGTMPNKSPTGGTITRLELKGPKYTQKEGTGSKCVPMEGGNHEFCHVGDRPLGTPHLECPRPQFLQPFSLTNAGYVQSMTVSTPYLNPVCT